MGKSKPVTLQRASGRLGIELCSPISECFTRCGHLQVFGQFVAAPGQGNYLESKDAVILKF